MNSHHHVGSNRYSGMLCNDGTLRLKKKNDVVRFITECLEIALSLGKDQVSFGEVSFECLAAILKECPRSISLLEPC